MSQNTDAINNLNSAPDSYLYRLLDEIGRNGETSYSQDARGKIQAILDERNKLGVNISDDGFLHHSA